MAVALDRALVTGASGFVGGALCGELRAAGIVVRGLSRRAISAAEMGWDECVSADLGTDQLPSQVCEGVQAVFHLAVVAGLESERGESVLVERDLAMTRSVLETAIDTGVRRFVYVSTVKAMGEGGDACLDEHSPATPQSAYGRAKLASESFVLERCAQVGVHAVVLRLPLVYGVGVKGNLATLIRAIARGRFPAFAGLSNRRSMVGCGDAASAALGACSNDVANGKVYLVTDGIEYSTSDIHHAVLDALGRRQPRLRLPVGPIMALARSCDVVQRSLGKTLPFNSARADKLLGSAWYSNARLRTELGFVPRQSLMSELPPMLAYMRAQGML